MNHLNYPSYGSPLIGRTFTSDTTAQYRFGFNGMEKDNESYGKGNTMDFGDRIYDTRIGRWLSLDPLAIDYPMLSPYSYVANNPLMFMDKDGQKIYPSNHFNASPVRPVLDKFIAQKTSTFTIKYLKQFYGSNRDLSLGYSALKDEYPEFAPNGDFAVTMGMLSKYSTKEKSLIAFNAYASHIVGDQIAGDDQFETFSRNELGWAATFVHEIIYHAVPNRQNHNITIEEFNDAVLGIQEYSEKELGKKLSNTDAVSLMISTIPRKDGSFDELLKYANDEYNYKLSMKDAVKRAKEIGFDKKAVLAEECLEDCYNLPTEETEHPEEAIKTDN